jgi:TM2 domain-containing membrane protein YozV
MKRLRPVAVFLLLLLSGQISWGAGDEGLAYAYHLFRAGENEAAALELDRYLFHHGGSVHAAHARYLLGLAQGRLGRYDRATAILLELGNDLERSDPGSPLHLEVLLQLANLAFRQKSFMEFRIYREQLLQYETLLDEKLLYYTGMMNLAVYIYEEDWSTALQLVEKNPLLDEDTGAALTGSLTALLERRPKRPVLAGLLAIFPGGGHFYAGRTRDGLRSFLINGAFVALIVFSLKLGIIFAAALFAIVETVLYGANIYGGINAAIQENARYVLTMRDGMLKLLPVPPLDELTVSLTMGNAGGGRPTDGRRMAE